MSKVIINPKGAAHSVTDEHFAALVEQPGYREADKAEITAFEKATGGKIDEPKAAKTSPTKAESKTADKAPTEADAAGTGS